MAYNIPYEDDKRYLVIASETPISNIIHNTYKKETIGPLATFVHVTRQNEQFKGHGCTDYYVYRVTGHPDLQKRLLNKLNKKGISVLVMSDYEYHCNRKNRERP